MMEELAKRAVACKHWRWMPGMRAIGGCVVATGCPLWLVDGAPRMPVDGEHYMWLRETTDHPDVLPDLSDPATLGCLLALVREAWGCDSLTCQPLLPLVGVHGWRVVGTSAKSGHTEAEALVAALEAAP